MALSSRLSQRLAHLRPAGSHLERIHESTVVPAREREGRRVCRMVTMHNTTVLLLALAAVFSGTVQATPLNDLREARVSALEFGGFRLEVALTGIKDWPFPIEGAGVSYQVEPDQIEIVVAVKKVAAESFRTACGRTVGRVREFLYVDANGTAPMGRSYLNAYFRGPWRGAAREATLRALDAITLIRVNVVGSGSCQAALIKAPVTFKEMPSK